ncbi:MAG: GntR family transcriptional regulator [Limisphaerales bacterium]
MSLAFNINTGSDTPIYKQIADHIRLCVATGRVSIGEQLPSVRALAEQLVLNPNTVAKAYGELARDGIIESRAGRGIFIIQKRKVFSAEEAWRRLDPTLDALIGEAMALDISRQELREAFEKKIQEWRTSRDGETENRKSKIEDASKQQNEAKGEPQ